MNTTISLRVSLVAFIASALFFVALPTQAAEMELVAEPTLIELKAKVEYLQSFLEALQNGEQSPAPTFLVVLKGDTATVVGTVARDPGSTMIEICGSMEKGRIDWGDGTNESLRGLGCSGDAHSFVMKHQYTASGSYRVVVTDQQEREKTHVLAVRVQ